MTKRGLSLVGIVALLTITAPADAFTHVVSQGETLAQIAIRFYGTPRFETALIGANSLDAHGGSAIVAGQPIEVPAPMHHRVADGETWFTLSRQFLGDPKRADVLARANRTAAWTPPALGQEIEVPAVIAHLVGDGDTLTTLAQRYYNDAEQRLDDCGQQRRRRQEAAPPRRHRADSAPRSGADRRRKEGRPRRGRSHAHRRRGQSLRRADARRGRYPAALARYPLGALRRRRRERQSAPRLGRAHASAARDDPPRPPRGLRRARGDRARGRGCAAWKANVRDAAATSSSILLKHPSPKIRAACR